MNCTIISRPSKRLFQINMHVKDKSSKSREKIWKQIQKCYCGEKYFKESKTINNERDINNKKSTHPHAHLGFSPLSVDNKKAQNKSTYPSGSLIIPVSNPEWANPIKGLKRVIFPMQNGILLWSLWEGAVLQCARNYPLVSKYGSSRACVSVDLIIPTSRDRD